MRERPLHSKDQVQLGESTTFTRQSLKRGCNRWGVRFGVSYELAQSKKYITNLFLTTASPIKYIERNGTMMTINHI